MKALIRFSWGWGGGFVSGQLEEVEVQSAASAEAEGRAAAAHRAGPGSVEEFSVCALESDVEQLGGSGDPNNFCDPERKAFWSIGRSRLATRRFPAESLQCGLFFGGQSEVVARAHELSAQLGKELTCIPLPRERLNYTLDVENIQGVTPPTMPLL